MDPLSATAAATQFFSLITQGVQQIIWLRGLFREIKSAPKLVKKIHGELHIFESSLDGLRSIEPTQVSRTVVQSLNDTLAECANIIQDLSLILHKFDDALSKNGGIGAAKRIWRQIAVVDKKPELEACLSGLERVKSTLSTSIGCLHLQKTDGLQRSLTAHSQKVEQSLNRVETSFKSFSLVSRNTFQTSVEIKDGVAKLSEDIEELRKDMPAMIIDGLKHYIGNTIEADGWVNALGRDQRRPTRDTEDEGQRPKSANSSSSTDIRTRNICEIADMQRTMIENGSNSASSGNYQYLPPKAWTRKQASEASLRKKSYSKSIPLPLGFAQVDITPKARDRSSSVEGGAETEMLRIEISFTPFRWLSKRGQALTIDEVYNSYHRYSWNFMPRMYNVVMDNSMVLSACASRDIEALRKLFQYRQASPFDIDTKGSTLMVRALNHCEDSSRKPVSKALELIEFLISQGADTTPFVDEFLDAYHEQFRGAWFIQLDEHDILSTAKTLNEICRLCLEHCQTDPFSDVKVLLKLWKASLGGRYVPSLDPTYLFQNRLLGLDDLVFETPDVVFSDLLQKHRVLTDPDPLDVQIWNQLHDQQYEALKYLCKGGETSIKSKVFSKALSVSHYRPTNSVFCPEKASHLLFHTFQGSGYAGTRSKPLAHHIHRMLVLLLKSGEDPEATCSCRTSWQFHDRGYRSVTDLAASEGLLQEWKRALEETGYNSMEIIDECLFDGFSDIFEPKLKRSDILSTSAQFIGQTVLSAISSIV